MPRPSSADHDLQRAGAVIGLEPDAALGGLAGGLPLLGAFDAMIDGVAQQMAERRIETFEDVAIDLRRLADDLQPDLLAEAVADVAHHARQRVDPVGEGPHPHLERLVIEAVRERA